MSLINTMDILILLLFIPALIGGIRKGFIRQLAGLIALLLGLWAASKYNAPLSEIICSKLDTTSSLVPVISFIVIFLIILLLVSLIGRLVSKIFQVAMLGWLDRIVGVLFSFLKTAFILSILIYILNSLDSLYNFMPKESISESRLYPPIQKLAPAVFPYLNEHIRAHRDIVPDNPFNKI